MALDQIPHLPGAAPNSPADGANTPRNAPEAVPKRADAVRLSDVTYDSNSASQCRSSASAFFLQPGYAFWTCLSCNSKHHAS